MPGDIAQEGLLGRSGGSRLESPRRSGSFGGLVTVGIALILLFALIGVVSAGAFVANRVGTSSKATITPEATSTNGNLVAQELARAQTQATAIVRQAQGAGHAIVGTATTRASRQARSIVSRARQQQPVATPAQVGPGQPGGNGTSPVPIQPQFAPTAAAGFVPSPGIPAPTALVPSVLSGLPKSWLVVAYGATFGNGPGTAGGITVTNRGAKTFTGVARVLYAKGGVATGQFGALAPGQTEVLALNGPTYPGGGYRITVPVPQ